MSDIVERLRQVAAAYKSLPTSGIWATMTVDRDASCNNLTDAADEIERLRAEVAGLREDAERYRALKERHGYIMVVRLINADGYSSAEKDALIDAFADAAIADIAAWESLSEAQKALQLDAQAKRAEINAARKGEA